MYSRLFCDSYDQLKCDATHQILKVHRITYDYSSKGHVGADADLHRDTATYDVRSTYVLRTCRLRLSLTKHFRSGEKERAVLEVTRG